MDGVLAQDKPLGDFLVAQSLGDELEHVELAGRKHPRGVGWRRSAEFAQEPGRALRLALGLATTFADVYQFWEFAEGFRDVPSDSVEA